MNARSPLWFLILIISGCGAFVPVTPQSVVAEEKPRGDRPNVLILIGDDHAGDTLGVAGDPHGATPNIDALARQGAYFKAAYCNAPVCTASRGSFMTGRLPHAVGVTRLPTPLPDEVTTIGEWLAARDYATGAIGKMHFNSNKTHGFTTRIDTPDYNKYLRANPPIGGDHTTPWRPFKDPASIWLNSGVKSHGLPDASMEATFFTNKAIEFFDKQKNHPYLLVLSFNEPHSPFKFPDDVAKRYAPQEFTASPVSEADRRAQPIIFKDVNAEQTQGIQASYYTSISYLDSKIGRVLKALDDSGQAENTIVVYIGDNGYNRGHHGRFEKHCFYERAVRVPFIVRWPKRVPKGKVITEKVELLDMLPTILELAGQPSPTDIQGQCRVDLIEGKPGASGRSIVFSEYLENEEAMVSDGRFKLIVGTGNRKRTDGYVTDDPTPGPYVHLYDRDNDPEENHDLAGRAEFDEPQKSLEKAMFERITTTRKPGDTPPPEMKPMEAIRWCLVPRD
jgi:choline-sulfatase